MSTKNKHDKKVNVINRTTSETLRLGGDADLRVLTQTSLRQEPSTISRKKIQNSTSSFQITGVSLTRSDFGDDSADDLDESHTDDISRVTDNETPSFSEDSRDTDDHQLYELPAAAAALIVLSEPPPLPAPKKAEEAAKPLDEDAGARFKVVKVPSVAPFNRGRWTCYDYLDNATQNTNYIYPTKQTFAQQESLDNTQIGTNQPSQATYVQGKYSQQSYLRPNVVNDTVQQTANLFCEQQLLADISPHFSSRPQLFHHIHNSKSVGISSPQLSISGRSDSFGEALQETTESALGALDDNRKKGSLKDDLRDIKVALTAAPAANSSSTPNNNNIDRKIEEALDAVKTHLMVAVHKEVDFLKTRVSTLEGRVNELEIENSILRVNYLLFKS